MTEQTSKKNNGWETFFAWKPIRMGGRIAWLRRMERAKAYFVALNDDSGDYGPKWVYRYPRGSKP